MDTEPLGKDKPKGTNGKRKMESLDLPIPKKVKRAGLKDTASYAKGIGVHIQYIIHVTATGIIMTVL